MITLKGEHVFLRALEPEDLEFIHDIENDESIWEISNTNTPYSKYLIKQYLEHSHKDIYEVKQLRLIISNYENDVLGMIDVFDFNPNNRRAGIGVLIKQEVHREKGYGTEALNLLVDYCFMHLDLHQLYCNISEHNKASINLFSNRGFEKIGLKKDWNIINGEFKSEYIYQLIKK